MLGIFDFRDALIRLFENTHACQTVPLEQYKGSRIGIDYLSTIDYIIHCPERMHYYSNLTKFKEKLREFSIDMLVVEPGLLFLDKSQLVRVFYKARWFREKFYYFLNIYKFVFNNDPAAQAKISEMMKLSVIGNSDNFTLFFYHHLFYNLLAKGFKKSGIPVIRAPQVAENQLCAMRASKLVDHIETTPLAFIVSDETRVIKFIDIYKEQVTYFDFELLAKHFNAETKVLKKAMFGSFLYFLQHESFTLETKSTLSTNEKIDYFKEKYFELLEANSALLDKQIKYFLNVFHDGEIDETFIETVAATFQFEKAELRAFTRLFMNAPVISETASIVNYPFLDNFPESKYLISKKKNFLTILFCKKYIDEDIFSLFNSCSNNKVGIYFPRYNFVEHHYAYKTYYKSKLDFVASKIAMFIDKKREIQYKFQYFKEPVEDIEIDFTKRFTFIPFFEFNKHFTFNKLIFEYYEFLVSKSMNASQNQHLLADRKFIMGQIGLNFLNDLGYVDLAKGNILIPGAAYVEIVKDSFDRELIILFELIRNNLLSNEYSSRLISILDDYNDLFKNNYFDSMVAISNELKMLLNSMCIEPYEVNNYLTIVVENSPQDSTEIDVINSSGLTFQSSSIQIDLKQSIKKTLNMFYKAIKDFDVAYQKYYQSSLFYDSPEKVLKVAFENKALKKIQIISRMLTFVKTECPIENLYDFDMYQFQQIINIVIKSLRNLMCGNFIAYLYETKQTENFGLIQNIFGKFIFEEIYALDSATLAKFIITQCLIYDALVKFNDPFAEVFVANLKSDFIKQKFKIDYDITEYLVKGKALIGKVFGMLNCINKYSSEDCFVDLCSHGNHIMEIMNTAIKILLAINKPENK